MADDYHASQHAANVTDSEKVHEIMMSHPEFKPGMVFEGVNVTSSGLNVQGNIYGRSTGERSNYYGATTVSGMNIQQDMPPELLLELATRFLQQPQQQQQQQEQGQEREQQPVAKSPADHTNAGEHMVAPSGVITFAGTGQRLGN